MRNTFTAAGYYHVLIVLILKNTTVGRIERTIDYNPYYLFLYIG